MESILPTFMITPESLMTTKTPISELSRLTTFMSATLKLLSASTQTPEVRTDRVPLLPLMRSS